MQEELPIADGPTNPYYQQVVTRGYKDGLQPETLADGIFSLV
jgi:hypothetical protein